MKLWPFKHFALTHFIVAQLQPREEKLAEEPLVSVVVPARNEAGNIPQIFARAPQMGRGTELVFVEGHSKDNTFEVIEREIAAHPACKCKLLRQTGVGKGDAVRLGFEEASGDILMILDADLTVPPEDLIRFYQAFVLARVSLSMGYDWSTLWEKRRCVSSTSWEISFSAWPFLGCWSRRLKIPCAEPRSYGKKIIIGLLQTGPTSAILIPLVILTYCLVLRN